MIVTVSNEYGSGALAIARAAAEELGYDYVDRQLPVVVSKRLGIAETTVEASEDAGRTLGERWLEGLELATPELGAASSAPLFDEELLRAVQSAVREYAANGNCVIVGRGSSAILGARPDVLRCFLHAPREWRVTHLVASVRADRKTAEKEVDRIDRARSTYLRTWYGLTFGDPRNYDLCIDVSRFSENAVASIVVAAVRARQS